MSTSGMEAAKLASKRIAMEEMLSRRRAENSFHEFVRQAWPLVEGNNPFIDGWHIAVICEHLEALVRREIRFLLINLPPRCSKPVAQDTLVLKNNGERVKIKDIKIGNKILTHKGRFKRVNNKFHQGELETLKITTHLGREVITALDHPFLTANGWVEAKDLQIDDVLGSPKVKKDFGIPIQEEEARLLGYFVGDGCLVSSALNITACDELEMKDIEHCCDVLGFTVKRQRYQLSKRPAHHNINTTRLNISRGINYPRDWARRHNIHGKNSYTKRVPKCIMEGDFLTIRNFIGAYFACDGTFSKKGRDRRDSAVSATSVNRELLVDVQHLFQRLGLRSRIRKKIQKIKTKKQGDSYVSYMLELSSQDDLSAFQKLIPVIHAKYKDFLDNRFIRQKFDMDILPDPIISIEPNGLEECYCLEVDDDHTFTANDIIVHNSTLLSVLFPAWVWLDHPEERFLYTSYAHSLSTRDSTRCRRVIESDWYQLRWKEKFYLLSDQNSKVKFDNDQSGYRQCTSQNSSATGEGGSILVADDPNNAKDTESDLIRESRNTWWDQVWSTRMNNPKRDCKIVVQQRIHEKDITGHIIGNDDNNSWTRLILPMELETNRRAKTIILPSTNGKIWEDPREKEGELLWPERIGHVELAQLKQSLGSQYRIAGQLQQRPAPESGGIIKKHWFKWWKYAKPPKIEHTIQSWDTALGAKDSNCYSACTTWGLFLDDENRMNIILLSLWRGKLEYPELRQMAQRMAQDYRDDDLNDPISPDRQHTPDLILIEAKSSGISLIQDLHKAGVIVTRFDPDKHGDKILRVRLITHLIEAGKVWLPAKPPEFTRLRDYADLMCSQASIFPAAESRDLVDTMTQVLLRMRDSGYLSNPLDVNTFDEETSGGGTKSQRPYY